MVFTALPLLSIILFVPSMLSGSSTLAVRSLSFLGIVSLASTAYIIRHFSLPLPDRKGKRPAAEVERAMFVRKALFTTNSVLCGLLVLVYLFTSPSSQSIWPALYLVPGGAYLCFSSPFLSLLPCFLLNTLPKKWKEKRHDEKDHLGSCHTAMFAIILIAREAMISVDLSHLEGLRYEYKGA